MGKLLEASTSFYRENTACVRTNGRNKSGLGPRMGMSHPVNIYIFIYNIFKGDLDKKYGEKSNTGKDRRRMESGDIFISIVHHVCR